MTGTATNSMTSTPICHIYTPVGCLGYGFEESLAHYELAQLVPTGVPTAIILDSGSTDSGPQKLAIGSMTCPRSSYVKDLTKLLRLVRTFRVPLIFSSAGGDGTDEHVKLIGEVIEEIAALDENKDYAFNTISLFSGIDKSTIIQRLKEGKLSGCGVCVPPATEEEINQSPRVVAQMGSEAFTDAMDANPDFNIIIGGRANDPAPYTGYAVHQLKRQVRNISDEDIKSRLGGFTHMGKIMECGGQCSLPKSHGAVSTVYADGQFEVRPTAPGSACTPVSVAAHTLYENGRPDELSGPGGKLYLLDANYEQLADGRTVRVSGSKYQTSKDAGKPYQFKLEAARVAGHRSIFMGSFRDHILISQIDSLLDKVRAYVAQQHGKATASWAFDFHLYGKDQYTKDGPGQVFVVGEALAPTKEMATSIASTARVAMIHGPYPGQKATSGNFGFGIGGVMEIDVGECAEFSLYHLMDLQPGEERLAWEYKQPASSPIGNLLRGSIKTIGQGTPIASNPDFRASIALVRDNLPKPASDKIYSSVTVPSSQNMPSDPKKLTDLCSILRSKNAGPYEITIDAMFYNEAAYRYIKELNILTPENVARALGIPKEEIVWMGFFDPALSFKVTVPRVRAGKKKSAGGFMENDVHGSQEHIELANLELPGPPASLPAMIFGKGEWSKFVAVAAAIGSVGVASIARKVLTKRK